MGALQIRRAIPSDLDSMMECYRAAQRYMVASGNPDQWPSGFPTRSIMSEAVDSGHTYVVTDSDGTIQGAACIIPGQDPTYNKVYGGGWWLNDDPYVTIHRLASRGKVKGIFAAILSFALTIERNVRADTHADNATMRHLFARHGFREIGIIRLLSGSERIAFHRAP